jgi:anti-sigma B factor antagonist
MPQATQQPFQKIAVEAHGDVCCVRLRDLRMDEKGVEEMYAEIVRLIDERQCKGLIVNLGPDEPLCMYSVFLAKMVSLHRRMQAKNGLLALAHLSDDTFKIFQVTGLEKVFSFYPDQEAALKALTQNAPTADTAPKPASA